MQPQYPIENPRSNRTFIIISVCIALCFLVYGILNYRSAFPEIGIDFKISREEALSKACDFLDVRRFDINGFKESIIFTYDVPARLFLEQQVGVKRTSSLTQDSVKVWYWKARFYQPMQKLEYQVFVDPDGDIIGFQRELPESEPARTVDRETARILAEAFLKGPKGLDIDRWRLVDKNTINRPSRLDHQFTYQLEGFRIRDESGSPLLDKDDLIQFPGLLKNILQDDYSPSQYLRSRFDQETLDIFIGFLSAMDIDTDADSAAVLLSQVQNRLLEELNDIIETEDLIKNGVFQTVEPNRNDDTIPKDEERSWCNRNLLSEAFPDYISQSYADYRMVVEVQGVEVGKFRYFLKVPDRWSRNYYRQRDMNDRLQNAAELLSILLAVAAVVCLIRNKRLNRAPWRIAVIFGGILFAVSFIKDINALPLDASEFVTTESYGAFIGRVLIYSLINGMLSGLLVMMLVGAGEPLYRKDNPNRLYLPNIFTRRGFQTREFIQATLMGYALAAFHFGFVVFYYLAGKKIGFWTPADISYDNALSTTLPWMYPLGISTSAALIEEFWFRFFGISFFRQLTKSKVLAVVIPALLWGFMHSSYPQQPGFARGIEVGIIGILAGIVMLRFGIWATLVWHFVVDAVWTGLFLFQSGQTHLWISGLVVCSGLAIPAVFAIIQRIRSRSPLPEIDLLNASVEQPPGQKTKSVSKSGIITPRTEIQSLRLKPNARRIALLVGTAGIILSLFKGTTELGDSYIPMINRQESIDIASRAVSERYSINPEQYKIAAAENGYRMRNALRRSLFDIKLSYVRKFGSIARAREIFFSPEGIPLMNWIVLFKKELDPKAFVVSVDQTTGEAYNSRILPESYPGASLSLDSALVLAEQAFKSAEPHNTLYQLVDTTFSKRINRIDYAFMYETIAPVIKDAHYRRKVRVIGDDVEVGWRVLKLPESWERHEMSRSTRWIVIQALLLTALFGVLVGMINLIRKRLRRIELPWRKGLILALIVLVVQSAIIINNLSAVWWGYETSRPISGFITSFTLGSLLQVVILSSISLLLITLVLGLNRARYGEDSLSLPSRSRVASEEAVLGLYGSIGLYMGTAWLLRLAGEKLQMPEHSFALSIPGHLSSFLPWLGETAYAVKWALIGSALGSILFLVIDNIVRKWWLKLPILVVLAVTTAGLLGTQTVNPTNSELAWSSVKILGMIGAGFIALKYWIKGRVFVLMTAVFVVYMLHVSGIFNGWSDSPYRSQGIIILLLGALPLVILVIRTFIKDKNTTAG